MKALKGDKENKIPILKSIYQPHADFLVLGENGLPLPHRVRQSHPLPLLPERQPWAAIRERDLWLMLIGTSYHKDMQFEEK